MKNFAGDPTFPIWLIGHSPPEAWADKLDTPLDPRHPARHSIWTSVTDPMQDRLYRLKKLRLDISKLYIRNAFSQPLKLPITQNTTLVPQKVLSDLFKRYNPKLVLTFSADAFMVTLWASGETPEQHLKTTKQLGEEFRNRINKYDDSKVNVIPLLHASIARGKFLEAHRDFVGAYGKTPPNYFDYVGTKLADLLIDKLIDKQIWIP